MSTIQNTLTLDDLLEEAGRKYPNLTVDGVVFRNILQMPSNERAEYRALQRGVFGHDDGQSEVEAVQSAAEAVEKIDIEKINQQEIEMLDGLMSLLVFVASDRVAAEQLFDRVGDNPAVIQTLFSKWIGGAQVGEA